MEEDILEKNKNQTPTTKPLRTYEGDVADVLAKRNTSAVTMALAESRRKQGESVLANVPQDNDSNTGKKIIISLICLVLVAGGIFALFYFYKSSPLSSNDPVPTAAQKDTSIIIVESKRLLPVDPTSPLDFKTKVNNELSKNQQPGTIVELIPVVQTTTGMGNSSSTSYARLSSQKLIIDLGIKMPDILYRSLNPEWMLGIYSNMSGQKSVFVIAVDNFYQNAFSGLLQWENIMADDLKYYLSAANTNIVTDFSSLPNLNISTSTTQKTKALVATSTIATTSTTVFSNQYMAIHGQFVDKIINNKDIREFVSTNAGVVFLYTFLDKNHLLFTSDESLVAEVMSRLEKQAYLR